MNPATKPKPVFGWHLRIYIKGVRSGVVGGPKAPHFFGGGSEYVQASSIFWLASNTKL